MIRYAAGNVGHSRAGINFNPGNLRPRTQLPPWPGQVEIDNNQPDPPYAIFATRAEGWCALELWILYAYDVLKKRTISEMINVFAPAADSNHPSAEAKDIIAKFGSDKVDPHYAVARVKLAKLIVHWEDNKTLWSDSEILSGTNLCDFRWPDFFKTAQNASEADVLNQEELDNIENQD